MKRTKLSEGFLRLSAAEVRLAHAVVGQHLRGVAAHGDAAGAQHVGPVSYTHLDVYKRQELGDAFVFAVLIVVLLVKPAGLLGKTVHEKV